MKRSSRQYHDALRTRVLCLLGNKCQRCGFSDPRALQVDHVDGGGSKDRVENGNTYYMYRRYLRGEGPHLQLLCANCNWIKRAERYEVNTKSKY